MLQATADGFVFAHFESAREFRLRSLDDFGREKKGINKTKKKDKKRKNKRKRPTGREEACILLLVFLKINMLPPSSCFLKKQLRDVHNRWHF